MFVTRLLSLQQTRQPCSTDIQHHHENTLFRVEDRKFATFWFVNNMSGRLQSPFEKSCKVLTGQWEPVTTDLKGPVEYIYSCYSSVFTFTIFFLHECVQGERKSHNSNLATVSLLHSNFFPKNCGRLHIWHAIWDAYMTCYLWFSQSSHSKKGHMLGEYGHYSRNRWRTVYQSVIHLEHTSMSSRKHTKTPICAICFWSTSADILSL